MIYIPILVYNFSVWKHWALFMHANGSLSVVYKAWYVHSTHEWQVVGTKTPYMVIL